MSGLQGMDTGIQLLLVVGGSIATVAYVLRHLLFAPAQQAKLEREMLADNAAWEAARRALERQRRHTLVRESLWYV